ncbi:MAG: YafY family transcriptional regulator [Burkholderiales bacterium]|nr:YafY family transcriptional regulator [Burkholderiales bacterium]
MRRADRLFRLVQLLRGRRLSTAAWLADKLEVSMRTVYRDVADLQGQGVPIEGEAGVGYRLAGGFDLPPLMFTTLEAQALVASVRLAQSRLDRSLALAAEDALGKIIGVLSPAARAAAEALPLYSAPWGTDRTSIERLGQLRDAAMGRRRIRFDYEDAQGAATSRTARPLGCYHWESVWTLAAWCEHRTAFRSFRIDRMRTLDVLEEVFRDEPGRTLPDFLRLIRSQRPPAITSTET